MSLWIAIAALTLAAALNYQSARDKRSRVSYIAEEAQYHSAIHLSLQLAGLLVVSILLVAQ